jgi:hypothetical protein
MVISRLLIFFLVIYLIIASSFVAVCKPSTSPIVYVSGDGTGDFNCDGRADQAEINKAIKFVSENPKCTTVHLKGPFNYTIMSPIYMENNTILEGDSDAVVKLVDHAGWTNIPMTPLIGKRNATDTITNITIRGFEINGNHDKNTEFPNGDGFYNMIYFINATNLSVHDMYMHDSQGDGLRLFNGENIKFYNNKISLLGHDGLYAVESRKIEAWNNEITCRTNSGLRASNSNNVKFHGNKIDSYPDAGPGIQIDRSARQMKNIEIYDNLIKHTWGPGIWVVCTVGEYESNLSNCHIHHNTFIDCGKNKNIEWVGGVISYGFHNVLIENNIFDEVHNAAVVNMHMTDTSRGHSGTGFTTTVRNNIIVNTLPRALNGKNTGYGVSNCLPKSHTMVLQNNCLYKNWAGNYKNCSSKTDIYTNPLFADEEKYDYHLQSTAGRWNGKSWVKDNISSPCINAGYLLSSYSNEPEPNGDRINIGRYGNTVHASKSM